ncbi:MAG: DUF4139 domain-containing protein [Pseudomonadota bacterium]
MTTNRVIAAAVGVALGVMMSAKSTAETAVTIYSKAVPGAVDPQLYRQSERMNARARMSVPGYAIVRDDRAISLKRGRSEVQMTDVAALIDPTTVSFESLTDPSGTRVIEQDFRFDLVGSDKLLDRYIDQKITVEQLTGDDVRAVTGTLLSVDGGMVLQMPDGSVELLQSWHNVRLGSLPGGLMTRPTLVWDVAASTSGEHDTRVSYETQGMTWWADYNLVWKPGRNANKGTLSMGAWVSILNQSGTGFDDTSLKLIAGDVQRAPQSRQQVRLQRNMVAAMAMEDASAGFEEKSFFEFHLYTLGRKTTIANNATKQIELFPQAAAVPAEKLLVYNGFPSGYNVGYGASDRNFGQQSNKKVDVYLTFSNREKNGLGIPLPAGRIRVSQLDDADDSLEFIGEDVIAHTPRNEDLRIRLGSSFDVLGQRKQSDYAIDTKARWLEETIEITLTNRKDVAQRVTIAEPLYRYANWTLIDPSQKFKKIDSRTIHFDVNVPADSEKTVSFKVRYTW